MVTLEGCLSTWVASEGIETSAMTENTPKVSIASLRERRDMAYLLEPILRGEPIPGQCHGSDTRVDALCNAFHGQGKR